MMKVPFIDQCDAKDLLKDSLIRLNMLMEESLKIIQLRDLEHKQVL